MVKLINITAIAILSISLAACGGKNEDTLRGRRQSVYTFTPEGNTDTTVSSHTSAVEEGKSVSVGFKTGGTIRRLTADEGSYVRKGQVLGYLDEVDYQLGVEQLTTQYDQLSSEIRRLEEMHARGNVSDNDYEKAVAGFSQLRTQLDMAKNKLAYTQLVAPVSGYIVERMMEEGEMTGAGTPVFRILDNSSVETTVALSSAAYSRKDKIVKCVGKSAVTGDTEIPLEIIGFIPDGDNNSLFRLRLRIPDSFRDRLLPGMNMGVDIFYRSDSGSDLHRIPSRALFERDGKSYVWTVSPADSTVTAGEVTIVGAPDGKDSMVRGLPDDSRIVAVGVHHLHDGEKVSVIGDISDLKEKVAL